MYTNKFIYNFFSIRGFLIFFLGLTSLFLFFSFISFYSKDPSFFYISNEIKPIYNICGFFGAHCASFFFYCFGSASFLFIFLLLYSAYLLMCISSFKQEWERLLFSIYLMEMNHRSYQLNGVFLKIKWEKFLKSAYQCYPKMIWDHKGAYWFLKYHLLFSFYSF